VDAVTVLLFLFIVGAVAWLIVPTLLFSWATLRHGWTGGSSGWRGPYLDGYVGGGGGGFSGGGFSGGGGGFGGGGASGGW
jgi:uncharacterized protein